MLTYDAHSLWREVYDGTVYSVCVVRLEGKGCVHPRPHGHSIRHRCRSYSRCRLYSHYRACPASSARPRSLHQAPSSDVSHVVTRPPDPCLDRVLHSKHAGR